jgi:hypothetical protein
VHSDGDESFFVLERRIEVLFEDAWRALGPEQFLHFVPSGFERFFRDFGHPAGLEDVEPLPVQESELPRLRTTTGEYGMELGP